MSLRLDADAAPSDERLAVQKPPSTPFSAQMGVYDPSIFGAICPRNALILHPVLRLDNTELQTPRLQTPKSLMHTLKLGSLSRPLSLPARALRLAKVVGKGEDYRQAPLLHQ